MIPLLGRIPGDVEENVSAGFYGRRNALRAAAHGSGLEAGAGAADDGLSGLRLRFPRVFEPPAAAGKRYAPLSGLREDMVRAYRRDE